MLPSLVRLAAVRLAAVRLAALVAALVAFPAAAQERLPYAEAGLTAEQAAAHLLSRFTYGARPGEAVRVGAGPEQWLDAQLDARLAEPALDARLAEMPALAMPADEIARTYRSFGRVAREARDAGTVGPYSDTLDARAYRATVAAFGRTRGYRPENELTRALTQQHVLRAALAENGLREVLVEFWFNHFNVAGQDSPARPHLLAYERDALRPNALGRFRDLLGATARHPAMLRYLDNGRSTAAAGAPTLAPARRVLSARAIARRTAAGRAPVPRPAEAERPAEAARGGVNENYARELLELHTLGVDGGYTQADVENVARAFTGWTVWPEGTPAAEAIERRGGARGVRDGLFLFRPDQHDAASKTVLGQSLPAGQGLEDGEAVLDLAAAHPATARHIARKLAVRFVSDAPPDALVERLADVFSQTEGDTRAVVRAIAYSPEFWDEAALTGKVKSPFELAVSAVRITGAEVEDARSLAAEVAAMGQALYRYPAPTGFPDRADHWLTAGTVAARVRCGLALATGGVPGVRLSAARLAGDAATAEDALAALAPRILPATRPADLAALARLAAAPDLAARLADTPAAAMDDGDSMSDASMSDGAEMSAVPGRRATRAPQAAARDTSPAAQALGILLGSPAFQRR